MGASAEVRARRAIFLFSLFQVTFTLLIWTPIFYDYQRTVGLTDEQIFRIQSVYYISFFALELPTGFLADRFGYRRSMLYGASLHVITSLLPTFWFSYAGFMTHWVLLAASRSLVSGASSAYLFNYLESLGQEELYKGAEGRARAYSLGVKVMAFAACGYMMRIHVGLPYFATALASLIAIAAVLRMDPLVSEHPQRGQSEPPKPQPSQVVRLLVGNPRLVLLMVQGIGIFVLTRIVQVNLFQPLLQLKGFGREAFGWILALNTLFEALGSAYPTAWRRWCSDFIAVFWLTLGLALCCLLMGPASPLQCVIWLTVFALLAGWAYPIQRQVLNQAIPDSSYRASLLSAESLLDRALCAAVAAQVGAYVAQQQIGRYLSEAGAVTIGVGLLVALLFWLLHLLVPRQAKEG